MKLTELFSSLANAVRKIKSSNKKMTPETCAKQLETIDPYDGSNDLNSLAEKKQSYLIELIEGTLENVHDESVSYIGQYTFSNCTLLESVNFPMCSYIGSNAFAHCSSLTSISFPMCNIIGSWAFQGCTSLTSVNFPACTSIGSEVFYTCTSLQEVSFPMCSFIGNFAFEACRSLERVYLNVSSVPQLSATTAFNGTPIDNSTYIGYYGSIYVPVSLYDAFCSATNWATYSSRIVSYF